MYKCISCFKNLTNKSKSGFCSICRKEKFVTKEEKTTLVLHSKGLNNREIAKILYLSKETIGKYLKKNGLNSLGRSLQIKNGKAICTICKKEKVEKEFPNNKYYKGKISKLRYCKCCHMKKRSERANNNLESFFKFVLSSLKQKDLNCNINITDLLEIYKFQDGKCFYSDEFMRVEKGKGHSNYSLSVDKIIPEKGYIKGNVVLCTRKTNLLKYNFNLQEIKEYMPTFYTRIENFLAKQSF